MKKCKVCKRELTGFKTKFCSHTCYLNNKSESAKRTVQLRKRDNPTKQCSICEQEFYPLRADHYACSKSCSKERSRQHQQIKRKSLRPFKIVKPMSSPKGNPFKNPVPLKIELKTTATFNLSDTTKDEVLAFLKAGGKIQKLPDEPAKKTPDVNIPFEYVDEDLYGGVQFGENSEQPSLDQTYGNQH